MTEYSSVRALAIDLFVTEATVDTVAITAALAALKQATLEVELSDPAVAQWLSDEHYAGGVISTAATMNKRAEVSGKGNPFNAVSRDDLVKRYNAWAAQFVQRLDAVESGSATAAQFLQQLAKFKVDPVSNTP
jgi:hypothetical protein